MSPPHFKREVSERGDSVLKRESSAKEIKKALSKISIESKFRMNIMAATNQFEEGPNP